jgi:hypothetical protein
MSAGAQVEPAASSLYLPHGPRDAIRKAFSGKVEFALAFHGRGTCGLRQSNAAELPRITVKG